MKKRVRTMMKGAAAIALVAVCMSCQSAKESVEDAAAHLVQVISIAGCK